MDAFLQEVESKLSPQLERDEGRNPKLYKDSRGFLTGGVGHNFDSDPNLPDAVIDIFKAQDMEKALCAVDSALPWARSMGVVRFGVLANMCFNMGIGSAVHGTGLLGFHTFLSLAQAGKFEEAAQALRQSLWFKQVGQRAVRLALQFQSGELQ